MKIFQMLKYTLPVLTLLSLAGCGGGGGGSGGSSSAASIQLSPSTLSFNNINSGTLTITNSGGGTLTALSIAPTVTVNGVTVTSPILDTSTTCGSSLAAGASCTYTLSSPAQGIVTITVSGTDGLGDSLSANATFTISPSSSVLVENPSADIVSGSSTFLTSDAAAALNVIFVDTGSLDFSRTSNTPSATCGDSAVFEYFAPQKQNAAACINFSDLVSDYQSGGHAGIKVVPWLSTTAHGSIDTYSDPAGLGTSIGDAIAADDSASGIGVECTGGVFASSTGESAFFNALAAALKASHKTVFIYEPVGPTNDPYSALDTNTLIEDGNVVAIVPLYDISPDNDNNQAPEFDGARPTGYVATAEHLASDAPDSSSTYHGLPVLYMIPAGGTDNNWQTYQYIAGGSGNPYPSNVPTDIAYTASVSCSGNSQLTCSQYQNNITTGLPSWTGAPNPSYPQMFGYTMAGLCSVAGYAGQANNDSALYSGVSYYAVRPAGFWFEDQGHHIGTFPEGIENASWELLTAWTSNSTNVCNSQLRYGALMQ